MINRTHDLPIVRQALLLGLNRSSIYYRAHPEASADLALMMEIEHLHAGHPTAGSRTLRALLSASGIRVGRQRVMTMMKRLGIPAPPRSVRSSGAPTQNG